MASDGLTDDEVVTVWGLVVEGFTAVSSRLRNDLDAELGIPLGWLEVLLRLLRSPGHRLGMGTLAQHSAITSGGFTRMADRMTAAGLVERQPCGSDRRVVWVALTPRGVELAERARTAHAAHLRARVLDVVGVAAAEDLAAGMRILRDDRSGQPSGPPLEARVDDLADGPDGADTSYGADASGCGVVASGCGVADEDRAGIVVGVVAAGG